MEGKKGNTFSGKLGFVLAVSGSAVGLGNIWRFPYLAAKYGGGIFLLVYILLAVTFGFTLIISETALGRMTGKGPVGAFKAFAKGKLAAGGWFTALIPMLIVPYYCVIGGWVIKYLVGFASGNVTEMASDTYFSEFTALPVEPVIWLLVFIALTFLVVIFGVEKGIERISKILMPVLLVLAVIICIYSVTRPGALEGVAYYLIPDFSKFSLMTVVAAMGQMFYSLSIAMGILITYGSYMKKEVDMESSVKQIEIMDTLVAILAGLMIIPAVFAFSGGDQSALNAGPSLMFITIPKVFESMGMGQLIGAVFFLLVLVAALTSSISLMETSVATIQERFGWSRKKACLLMVAEMAILGIPCSLGFGVWDFIKPLGLSILDFFDFITNSVMMPISAFLICLLVIKGTGLDAIANEVKLSSRFRRERTYRFLVRGLVPVGLLIIFVSSVLNVFGIITI